MTTEVRITDPVTGAQKGQKLERFDLIPFDALEELARVYGIGAKKYADDNWLGGYAWRLSLGALLRHVSRFMCGEDRDPETGCLHLAHAAWHCLTLLTFSMRGLGTDDRRPPTPTTMRPEAPKFYTAEELNKNCKVTINGIELESVEHVSWGEPDGDDSADVDEPIPFDLVRTTSGAYTTQLAIGGKPVTFDQFLSALSDPAQQNETASILPAGSKTFEVGARVFDNVIRAEGVIIAKFSDDGWWRVRLDAEGQTTTAPEGDLTLLEDDGPVTSRPICGAV